MRYKYGFGQCSLKMSLLPIIKRCKATNVHRLFSGRNVPQHSPIFKLRLVLDQDKLGKHLGRSMAPNCMVHKSVVVATKDIAPGVELTLSAKPITLPDYLDSL